MSFAPDITDAFIFTTVRAFLLLVLENTDVIRFQVNRVAEPDTPDFVVMTAGPRVRLATNTEAWDQEAEAPTAVTITAPTQVDIQLDVHGPASADAAQTIRTLFRSTYATAAFPATLQPLYADDPHQVPFVNGERQYEDRWVVTVHLQANPTVSTPAQFAATVSADIAAPADSGAS